MVNVVNIVFNFKNFQMNREQFIKATRSVLVHLKAYNFKLCRKGLLEIAEGLKLVVGDLKEVENDCLDKTLRMRDSSNNSDVLKLMNTEIKLQAMRKEIRNLDCSLKSLLKTIGNIKAAVKSRVNDSVYILWYNRVNII